MITVLAILESGTPVREEKINRKYKSWGREWLFSQRISNYSDQGQGQSIHPHGFPSIGYGKRWGWIILPPPRQLKKVINSQTGRDKGWVRYFKYNVTQLEMRIGLHGKSVSQILCCCRAIVQWVSSQQASTLLALKIKSAYGPQLICYWKHNAFSNVSFVYLLITIYLFYIISVQ